MDEQQSIAHAFARAFGRTIRVAVVSGHTLVRAVVNGASWFNDAIRAFPPNGLGDALVYLEIPDTRLALVEHTIAELKREVTVTQARLS